jgi:RNA polymerase sigma-70 factor (ECF subfamily)
MSDSSHQDAALIEGAVAGDADAFGELYLLHLDAIYRYVFYRVGDPSDAEDLTEQVFLNAWKALPNYERRKSPFASWLYRIAHNAVVDYHRRQRPAVLVPSREEVEWVSDQPLPVEQVIKAEEVAELAAAIAQLPDDQQQVIVLRFIEGLKHVEVARIMGKSEGACRVIQHRALVALSRLLSGIQGNVDA